ncbi:MAG: response regulator [Vallitaleaceae bacterium]|nr:response regulator [Vallitaleaceae bacterium]
MLHCAICEDDKSAANVLQEMIIKYPTALNCAVFFDPLMLLTAIQKGQRYDLYLLDIMMPSMSGIDLAREIRKMDDNCVIVFQTCSDEFHRDAFHVEALQYLNKPVDKSMLYRTLDRALNHLNNKDKAILPIQTKSGIRALNIEEIVYIESYRHVLTFHLYGGSSITTVDSTLSLEKLLGLLHFPPFCAPYRGFIVNMNHVECLLKFQFVLSTGAIIPVPQKQFSKVRQIYSDFLLTRYEKGAQ